MRGNSQVRLCTQCRKNVYNVARLSRSDAVELIERAEGTPCLRLTRRLDGTIATGDCWTRLRRARRRGRLAFAIALPVFVVMNLWTQWLGLRALIFVLVENPMSIVKSRPPLMGTPRPLPPDLEVLLPLRRAIHSRGDDGR